jgi:predicted NAD/FAD-binding protein
MKVAVVGSGVSGLTAAYLMQHDVHVFESGTEPGGHTRTVTILEGDRSVNVDVGFMVYNEDTYRGFSALLTELDVETQPSEMSFSVSCGRCGVEFGTRGLKGMLAQPANVLRPSWLGIPLGLRRFYRDALRLLDSDEACRTTLGEFLDIGRYGDELQRHVIVPLVASIWSTPASAVSDFPARHLFKFLANHGLLGFAGRREWRTIVGGASKYVERMVEALPNGVRTDAPVVAVTRHADGVIVELTDGSSELFDAIVLACHSDQSLRLLTDPNSAEKAALRGIEYMPSTVVLHSDASAMANKRAAWSSWNYKTQSCTRDPEPANVTYHLNRLQRLDTTHDYFLSLNPVCDLEPDLVIQEFEFSHPLYTRHTFASQDMLRSLNGTNRTYYAGAYMGNGFHEDGYRSGADVADTIGRRARVPALSEAMA